MSITFTPSWTDTGTQVIAPQCLARGSLLRATLDLSSKFGAYLFVGIGKGGITALTNGITVEVRRTANAGAILMPAAPWYSGGMVGGESAILKTIDNADGYPAGSSAFLLAGTGTPAANDDFCAWGRTTIPDGGTSLPDLEFHRVSKFDTATVTMDAPCKIAKIDDEILTSKAYSVLIWLVGGCTYELIVDYGDDAAGEAVAVAAYSQTYDSEVAA